MNFFCTIEDTSSCIIIACNFLNNWDHTEPYTEPCLDANCHKSEEECLSRAGTMNFIYQPEFYPSNMIYDAKANGGNADAYNTETINRFRSTLAGMKHLMNEKYIQYRYIQHTSYVK